MAENQCEYLLSQRLSNALLGRLRRHTGVAAKWVALTDEFTQKTMYAVTTLKADFLARRCTDDDNIRKFLDSLETDRESLAVSGVTISDEEYQSAMVNGVPPNMRTFASAQIEMAKTLAAQIALIPTITVTPQALINMSQVSADQLRKALVDEADRRDREAKEKARAVKQTKHAPNVKSTKDNALAVGEDKKAKNKKKKFKGNCHNCGKTGHMKCDC